MFKKWLLIFFLCTAWGCNSSSPSFVVYQNNKILPILLVQDHRINHTQIEHFRAKFFEKTGFNPPVNPNDTLHKNSIEFSFTNNIPQGFKLIQRDNKLKIQATDSIEMNLAIEYFFSHYLAKTNGLTYAEKIQVPKDLNYINTPDFEYREPFFPPNSDEKNRIQYQTHSLDYEWGLWGHNIHKVIEITPEMWAEVEGEKNEEQLCFSSVELKNALKGFLQNQKTENPTAKKFMLMPEDNNLACTCEHCLAKGNTKKNASPAVFALLNELATEFPTLDFFSTAYITTQNPPKGTFAPNVGVMLSTMDFPKGIVLEKSPKKAKVIQTINAWKQVTQKLYLWDYAINFDHYFESYPTVKIAQANLKFYKEQGIKGIFLHGNEGDYSIFEDLKYHLYAKLLRDLSIDVEQETKNFLQNKYPKSGTLLFEYYNTIENRALESTRMLDIYGGWQQAKKKYLDTTEFAHFYEQLVKLLPKLSEKEQQDLQPLLLALSFQRLEIARTQGVQNQGFASQKKEHIIVKPEIKKYFELLKKCYAQYPIEKYNELGFSVKQYIQIWENEILNKQHKNLLLGKKVKALTELDEDYPSTKILTDGALGFNDYFNNWVLFTVTPEVKLEVQAEEVRAAKEVRLSFLNAPKHRIYLPKQVVVAIDNKTFSSNVYETDSFKQEVIIPIEISENASIIHIQIIKNGNFNTKSIACDEIIFR